MPASFGFHPAFAWPLPYGEPRDGSPHRVRRRRAGIDQAPRRRVDRRRPRVAARRTHAASGRRPVRRRRAGLGSGALAKRHLWRASRPEPAHRFPRHAVPRHLDQARRARSSASSRGTAMPTPSALPAISATSPACSSRRVAMACRWRSRCSARPLAARRPRAILSARGMPHDAGALGLWLALWSPGTRRSARVAGWMVERSAARLSRISRGQSC